MVSLYTYYLHILFLFLYYDDERQCLMTSITDLNTSNKSHSMRIKSQYSFSMLKLHGFQGCFCEYSGNFTRITHHQRQNSANKNNNLNMKANIFNLLKWKWLDFSTLFLIVLVHSLELRISSSKKTNHRNLTPHLFGLWKTAVMRRHYAKEHNLNHFLLPP